MCCGVSCIAGKGWKRMVTKPCYVGEGFTRKPPKFERFIRPMVSTHVWVKAKKLYLLFLLNNTYNIFALTV